MEGERKPASSSMSWLLFMGVGAVLIWAWATSTARAGQPGQPDDTSARAATTLTSLPPQRAQQAAPEAAPRRSVASLVPTFPNDPAPTDGLNYFSSIQMDAGAVLTAVFVCSDAFAKKAPAPTSSPEFAKRICGCLADAMRMNKGAAPLNMDKHWATKPQQERCASWAETSSATDGRSPFNNSAQENSVVVSNQVSSCMYAVTQDGRPAKHSVALCGCLIDALRAHPGRPDLTPDEKAKCGIAADYFVETGRHMTARQFKALGQASGAAAAPPPQPRPAAAALDGAPNGGAQLPVHGTYDSTPRAPRQTFTPLPVLDQSKPVHVDGYFRKNGTYVRPHTRRSPR
jgi:hypothetical protein